MRSHAEHGNEWKLGIDPDTLIYDRLNRPRNIAQCGEPIRQILQ